MRLILKQDVEKVGRRGDLVDVTPGFGRNFLIPKKLALEVTASNVKMVEIEKQSLKKKADVERQSFQSLIQKLNEASLTFRRRAGEKDVIFGSVSAADIKEELDKLGYDVDKKKILLADPIKRLGNFSVPIKVYQDDRAEVKVVVLKEEGEEEEKMPTSGEDKES